MGYDVSITRAPPDAEEDGPPIHREEFLALLATMPMFVIDPESWSGRRAEDGTEEREHAVSVGGLGPNADRLWTGCGEITAKYPKAETLRWMVIAARRLDAYVRGDDGEEYELDDNGALLADGLPYRMPSDEPPLGPPDAALMGWIRSLPATHREPDGEAPFSSAKPAAPEAESRAGQAILVVVLVVVAVGIMLS